MPMKWRHLSGCFFPSAGDVSTCLLRNIAKKVPTGIEPVTIRIHGMRHDHSAKNALLHSRQFQKEMILHQNLFDIFYCSFDLFLICLHGIMRISTFWHNMRACLTHFFSCFCSSVLASIARARSRIALLRSCSCSSTICGARACSQIKAIVLVLFLLSREKRGIAPAPVAPWKMLASTTSNAPDSTAYCIFVAAISEWFDNPNRWAAKCGGIRPSKWVPDGQ